MRQQIRFSRSYDAVRIAYSTSGSGPPIVRVANWLTHLDFDSSSPIWSHWFEELSRGHTLVRYDARGTGLSDRDVDSISLNAWVEDLAAVVNDLGLEQFPLFGFCQGAPVAVAFAARYPQRVSRLILYDSYACGALVDGAEAILARQAEVLAEMIEIGWGRQTSAFREVFANLIIPGASREQQRWLAELQRRTVSAQVAVQLWRAFHRMDVRTIAPHVRAPTLIFHVKNGVMVPFEAGRQMARLIPDARFLPLDSQNHILLANEPSWLRFLDEVRRFLKTDLFQAEQPPDGISELTDREREILELMARGMTNSEIAAHLTLAPKTVRNYVTRIYDKLQENNRARVIVLARKAGYGR